MNSSKIAAGLILLFAAATAYAQQTPPPGGPGRGGRGGGGFTQPDPIDFADNTGWTSMFDGSSLKGWDGNMDLWHVENGAITVESVREAHRDGVSDLAGRTARRLRIESGTAGRRRGRE